MIHTHIYIYIYLSLYIYIYIYIYIHIFHMPQRGAELLPEASDGGASLGATQRDPTPRNHI